MFVFYLLVMETDLSNIILLLMQIIVLQTLALGVLDPLGHRLVGCRFECGFFDRAMRNEAKCKQMSIGVLVSIV